jgi:hypothetical protein
LNFSAPKVSLLPKDPNTQNMQYFYDTSGTHIGWPGTSLWVMLKPGEPANAISSMLGIQQPKLVYHLIIDFFFKVT